MRKQKARLGRVGLGTGWDLLGGRGRLRARRAHHRDRAGGFHQARLPAALMAVVQTLREWLERITKSFRRNFRPRASPNFPPQLRSPPAQQKARTILESGRSEIKFRDQVLLLFRMIKFLAARNGAAVKEALGFGAA